MNSEYGPVKLYAMADILEERLQRSHKALTNRFGDKIDVPAERRIDQSRLEIRYSPTLAGAMVDALPYLVEYPYGCTEQTMSRFAPDVVVADALKGKLQDRALGERLGLDPDRLADIAAEAETNLEALSKLG